MDTKERERERERERQAKTSYKFSQKSCWKPQKQTDSATGVPVTDFTLHFTSLGVCVCSTKKASSTFGEMLPLPPPSLMTLTLREATGLQQRLRRPFCRINTQQRRCRRCCRRRAPSPKAQLALSLSLILQLQKRSSQKALFQSELTAASRALAQLSSVRTGHGENRQTACEMLLQWPRPLPQAAIYYLSPKL